MQIKALTAFSDGVLSMYEGEIADVATEKANALIADGYAEEYVAPAYPEGTKSITENGDYDVSAYASATVDVAVCSLTLNAGEGSGGGTEYYAAGYVVTLSAATPPAGYTFSGWATTQSAETPDVGETYQVTQNTTLYAVYTATQE